MTLTRQRGASDLKTLTKEIETSLVAVKMAAEERGPLFPL